MTADELAGFDWLFSTWQEIVTTLIVITAPLFPSITGAAGDLVAGIGFAWLALVLLRIATQGVVKALASGLLIFLLMVWGLQPAAIKTSANGTVQASNIASLGYNVSLTVQSIFGRAMTKVLSSMKVDGGIMPAASVTQAAVDRTADQYAETDLARLIQDYNAQCSPQGGVIKGAEVPLEAYHAIGLAGGAGLGVPDSELGAIGQMMTLYEGAVDLITGTTSIFSGNAVERAYDAGVMRSRRADGLAAIEAEGRGFVPTNGTPYILPKTEYWASVYSGESEAKTAYLSLSDAPFELSPVAWSEQQGPKASQGFMPRNCVEAYKTAQFAAEQAYQALIDTGGKAASGQRADTDSGRLGAALAWQRVINRTMNGGQLDGASAGNAVGGIVAVTQGIKNEIAWYEMYSLLPAFIAGIGVLLWLLLLSAPVFILAAPVVGIESFTAWIAGIFFCALCIVFAQMLTVGAAVAMSGAAVYQAAVASGWQGNGSDIDSILGGLQMVGPLIIGTSVLLPTWITKVSIGPLGAAARSAVATTTDAAEMAGKAIRGVMAMNRVIKQAGKTPRRAPGGGESRDGGGGGGGGRGGAPSNVSGEVRELHRSTLAGMRREGSEKAQNYQGMMRRKSEAAQAAANSGGGDTLVPPKKG